MQLQSQIEIYYFKDISELYAVPALQAISMNFLNSGPINLTFKDFNKYYKKVHDNIVSADVDLNDEESIHSHLQKLFELYNSNVNPLSDKKNQDSLVKNEMHTSMSVGDIIKIKESYYAACMRGFSKINIKK